MLVFPQLGLYAVIKRSIERTVVNELGDGRADLFADPDAAAIAWEMRPMGMTRGEWDAVESLFGAVAGRWGTFTFLDPAGNLLARSEEFGATAWTNGALIQLTAGIGDPFGTARATRVVNAGTAAESVAQTLGVPGNFQYCVSVWARTAGGSSVTLKIGGLGKTFALGTQWSRMSFTGGLGTNATAVTFGAELEAGASVDLFGMQVEAQLAASDYKKTGAHGGVYPKARFADDRITVMAQSTDVYDAVIRIVNTEPR